MINVYSEIGALKSVLLHRPGEELENLTPKSLRRLLFDDIPHLEVALKEHDTFAETLRKEGVEVLHLVDMVSEALDANPEVLPSFIKRFIDEADVKSDKLRQAIQRHLGKMKTADMVRKMIEGIRTTDIPSFEGHSIMDMLESEYPFYTDPMPNIIFQRDPFASVGRGVSLHRMNTETRQRETFLSEYMLRYHPRFKADKLPHYYSRHEGDSLEGGDILVLNDKTLMVGISARTSPYAIEKLAKNLFDHEERFQTVLALNIPKTRAFMHLDTVLTQVDHGMFTVHPGILKDLRVFALTKKHHHVHAEKLQGALDEILATYVGRPVELVHCGGEDVVASEREQWSDGANTLAIAPGKVITYSRNHVTNRLLRKKGITVIEIPSSELSRGRGGPRCMSMPLVRESLTNTSGNR